MYPKARSDKLLVYEIGQEFVVYDRERHNAHRLNSTAGRVWRKFDGKTSVEQITDEMECDHSVVMLALDHLKQAHLLTSEDSGTVSRRAALRKVASIAAAGMVLPVVASIPAPLAATAQSGTGTTTSSTSTLTTPITSTKVIERDGIKFEVFVDKTRLA